MAFVGELKVRILIDEAGLASSISSADSQLSQLKTSITGIETAAQSVTLRDLENRFSNIGKIGIGAFADISKAGGDFQESLLRVNTIANLSEKDLKELGDSVKNISETTGLAVKSTDALASEYEVLSSGFTKTADASKVLEASLRLSAAGNADAKDTTRVLTAVLNAYGETAEQAAKRADQLFQTVNIGVTTVPELSQSLGRVLSVASTAGVSFEELSASIAVATQRGQTTSAAIDGLSGILNSFIKPTKEARKEMDALGITINEATLKQDGFAGTLEKINKASNGNVESLGKIVGTHAAIATSSALLRDAGVGLRTSIDQITNSAGSNKAAVDILATGTKEASAKMSVAFENLKISAAEAFLPLQTDAVNALTGIITALDKTPSSLKLAALAFGALGTALTLSAAALIGFRLAMVPLKAELTLLGATVIPRLTIAYTALNIPLGTAISLFVAKSIALVRNIALSTIAAVRNFSLAASFASLSTSVTGSIAALGTFNGLVGIAAAGFVGIAAAAGLAIIAYTELEKEVQKANQALIESDNLQKKGKKTQGSITFSTAKILSTDVTKLAKEGLTKDTVTQRILDEQRGATDIRNSGGSDEQVQKHLDNANKLKKIRKQLELDLASIKNNQATSVVTGISGDPKETKEQLKEVKAQEKIDAKNRKSRLEEVLRNNKDTLTAADKANKEQVALEKKANAEKLREQKKADKEKEKQRKAEERERKKAEKEAARNQTKEQKEELKRQKEQDKILSDAAKRGSVDPVTGKKKTTTINTDATKKSAFDFEVGSRQLRKGEFSGDVMSVAEFAKQSNEDFGNNPFKNRLTKSGSTVTDDLIANASSAAANPKVAKSAADAAAGAILASQGTEKDTNVTVPLTINLNGKSVGTGEISGSPTDLKSDSSTFNSDFELGEV